MEIRIPTIYGTFIVPRDKVHSLISWLQSNAVLENNHSESKNNNSVSQLLNE
jgi:hypothetical protein